MNRRTIILVVALLLAAVASFAVWRYLDSVEQDVRADVAEVTVYRARALIEPQTMGEEANDVIVEGTALAQDVVFDGSTIVCPGAVDPTGENPCVANPQDLGLVLRDRVAAGPISAGQLITSEMFVTPAEADQDRLSAIIPAAKVAVAISPGIVGGVGGLIEPGDTVNVLATFPADSATVLNRLLVDPDTRGLVEGLDLLGTGTQPQVDEDGNPVAPEGDDPLSLYLQTLPAGSSFTQTIFQDIPVLAVGGRTENVAAVDGETLGVEVSVVLEVTTEQAEQLELARQVSVLALALLPADETYAPFDPQGAITTDVFEFFERIREDLESIGVG